MGGLAGSPGPGFGGVIGSFGMQANAHLRDTFLLGNVGKSEWVDRNARRKKAPL